MNTAASCSVDPSGTQSLQLPQPARSGNVRSMAEVLAELWVEMETTRRPAMFDRPPAQPQPLR